jgi:hypothetical protein
LPWCARENAGSLWIALDAVAILADLRARSVAFAYARERIIAGSVLDEVTLPPYRERRVWVRIDRHHELALPEVEGRLLAEAIAVLAMPGTPESIETRPDRRGAARIPIIRSDAWPDAADDYYQALAAHLGEPRATHAALGMLRRWPPPPGLARRLLRSVAVAGPPSDEASSGGRHTAREILTRTLLSHDPELFRLALIAAASTRQTNNWIAARFQLPSTSPEVRRLALTALAFADLGVPRLRAADEADEPGGDAASSPIDRYGLRLRPMELTPDRLDELVRMADQVNLTLERPRAGPRWRAAIASRGLLGEALSTYRPDPSWTGVETTHAFTSLDALAAGRPEPPRHNT